MTMPTQPVLWFWYLLGAILCLAWKWQRYCYESKGSGISFWAASKKWLEIYTLESQVSWIVTIGAVWVIGTLYIERIGLQWLFDGAIMEIPAAPAMAFLLGSLAELIAPAFVKWALSKLPFVKTD